MSVARRRAKGRRSSWATTWFTRPSRSASSASMKFPVSDISMARRKPIDWASRTVIPPAWHDAHPGVGVGEAGPVRGDEQRALQGDLQAAGDGYPVDRTDDRLVDHRQESVEAVAAPLRTLPRRPRRRGRGRLARNLLQVDAGAERGIGAGQHDRIDVGGLSRRLDGVPQRVHEFPAQRVARRRPVEGDGRDAFRHLGHDDGLSAAHRCTLVGRGGRQGLSRTLVKPSTRWSNFS